MGRWWYPTFSFPFALHLLPKHISGFSLFAFFLLYRSVFFLFFFLFFFLCFFFLPFFFFFFSFFFFFFFFLLFVVNLLLIARAPLPLTDGPWCLAS